MCSRRFVFADEKYKDLKLDDLDTAELSILSGQVQLQCTSRLSKCTCTCKSKYVDMTTLQCSGRTEQLHQQSNRDIVKNIFKLVWK